MPNPELPLYQSHKTVRALKIARIDYIGVAGATLTPAESGYAPFQVEWEYVSKHQPAVGGYYVRYGDGYESFSPAEAFEAGNTRLLPVTTLTNRWSYLPPSEAALAVRLEAPDGKSADEQAIEDAIRRHVLAGEMRVLARIVHGGVDSFIGFQNDCDAALAKEAAELAAVERINNTPVTDRDVEF